MNSVENSKLLFYKTQAAFERDKDLIRDDAVVYIGNPPFIYTHGVYFKGGGGGQADIDISGNPIYYYLFTDKDTPAPSNISSYTEVSTLNGYKQCSIAMNAQYSYIAIPTTYSVTSVVTSNNEPLSIDDDFDKQIKTIDGKVMNVYRYMPVVAPTLSLIFTINIPE